MAGTATTALRVRSGAASRTAVRRWLGELELPRHGLPEQAIVAVRRLQATPAALARPDADPLARALRCAVRPAHEGCVGAGVVTVWFEDEAELLACLARDALGGALGLRWWWPLLLAASATPERAQQRWMKAAPSVPWALRQLADDGADVRWLSALGPSGRDGLLHALEQAWPVGGDVRARLGAAERRAAGRVMPPVAAGRMPASTAFEGQAPGAASPAAADPVAVLLRLADRLRVAPHRLADDGLDIPGLAQGLAHEGSDQPATPAARAPRDAAGAASQAATALGAPTPGEPPWSRSPSPPGPAPSAHTTALPHAPRPAADGPLRRDRPSASRAFDHTVGAQGQPGPLAGVRAGGLSSPEPATDTAPSGEAYPLTRARAATRATARPAATAEGPTAFGGALFLFNVALSLGLYGDFTRPRHAGLALSPWHLVHAAGRAAAGAAWRRDALAAWCLARGGPVGADEATTAPWQLGAEALRPFAADPRPWHGLQSPGVCRLWHPAGFALAEAATIEALAPALAERPEPAAPVQWHKRPRPLRPLGAVARSVPLLRARLALALGLPVAAAAALALHLPARWVARPDRLDLHLRLAELPLALRLAGLDRDPGWVPAAGCDIRFHFD